MELHITIFLAAAFVSLAMNLGIIVVLYRLLSRTSARVEAERERTDDVLRGLRATVEGAARASEAAADWSGRIRDGIQDLEPQLLETSSRLGYALAKVDFKMDRYAERVSSGARSFRKETRDKVAGPVTEVLAVLQGARAFAHLLTLFAENRVKESEDGSYPHYSRSTRKVL